MQAHCSRSTSPRARARNYISNRIIVSGWSSRLTHAIWSNPARFELAPYCATNRLIASMPDSPPEDAMSEITGAEVLLKCFVAEGVKFMFGLPCPEVDPILAKLDDYGIRFVPIRHEAAAVHMAEGLYKTTGQIAVVLGNPGPGSANLLPGVITARHEGVPVIVFTAQHRMGIVYPSPPSTFQGQDQLDVFKT